MPLKMAQVPMKKMSNCAVTAGHTSVTNAREDSEYALKQLSHAGLRPRRLFHPR
jgi:hypothetical protein